MPNFTKLNMADWIDAVNDDNVILQNKFQATLWLD